MAVAPESFYRDVVRSGYRSAYLVALARMVAEGELDLESLARATVDELPDAELEERLLALPGVGPLRGGAHHDDDRPELSPDPRFLDAAEVRAPDRQEDGERRTDPAPVPPLRASTPGSRSGCSSPEIGSPEKVVQASNAGHTALADERSLPTV